MGPMATGGALFRRNRGILAFKHQIGLHRSPQKILRGIDKTTHFTIPTNRVCQNMTYSPLYSLTKLNFPPNPQMNFFHQKSATQENFGKF